MKLREWLRSGRLQYITLWALAVICIGGALAEITLFGFEPLMLAMLATVFAASATAYEKRSRCETTR